jgi:L-threonylcarbamoyladenylate synthase
MSPRRPPETVTIESGAADVARSALERCIGSGGVALFPSDGLYGLACDPLDAGAIARIHRLKGRDEGKSSAVMYFSPLAMRELVAGFGPRTAAAVSALLPGPVTLVVANPGHRYSLACREDSGRLGVRLLAGPLAGIMCPVFQTSANLSGELPPARFEDVPASIAAGVDLALDGGSLNGLPSTVVDIASIDEDGSWQVLRQGALSAGDLASALASVGLG